ncbi:MAG: PTS sugar transporter subunit IIA [candidate division Zixibacteria bacterium]|nr:PTS sugar transporter subunit IIA [Candidatus Tariuqbacter arcticus]
MALSRILRKEAVLTELNAQDRFDAIKRLVKVLVDTGALDESLQLLSEREVIERENTCPTGLDHGVALPHALVDGLNCEIAAFAKAVPPIDFSAKDGVPADLIFLLLVPQEPVVPHVRTLSQIVHLFNNESKRNRIRRAKTKEEIYEIFK